MYKTDSLTHSADLAVVRVGNEEIACNIKSEALWRIQLGAPCWAPIASVCSIRFVSHHSGDDAGGGIDLQIV